MHITASPNKGPISIMVMHLHGELDGSNYMDFIAEAEKLYNNGAQEILLDLSDLTYMSSAGIIAMQTIDMLFCGQKRIVEEKGWAAYRALDRDRHKEPQIHVKLLGLNSNVHQVLEMVGFGAFFEIYTDGHQALASFGQSKSAGSTPPQGVNP